MAEGVSATWTLDPGIDFLNHGSFGAAPRPVQQAQQRWRDRLEAEPVRFFQRELYGALDEARGRLADFLGARHDDLAFVPNATAGVNAVVGSYAFEPGDEILVTDHVYNACRNVVDHTARRTGARVVVAHIPFPLSSPATAAAAVLGAAGARTRLAMVEHVTSPTALVLPIGDIVGELTARGVDVLVDGAHAPGMVDLDLEGLGATFYTGNCHKWLCAPKGAGFLHVHRGYGAEVLPAILSHGYNAEQGERSRFHQLFDWTGTDDPTAFLSVPAALDAIGSLLAGGWPELRERNRRTALAARDVLCEALGVAPPAPDEMIGSMAAVPLPDAATPPPPHGRDALQERLFFDHAIEVPVVAWPAWPKRLVRVSAQAYNSSAQYERLARVLVEELRATGPGPVAPGR
jgi:isopenicillin-N epimerase